jgi:hypothetical protein
MAKAGKAECAEPAAPDFAALNPGHGPKKKILAVIDSPPKDHLNQTEKSGTAAPCERAALMREASRKAMCRCGVASTISRPCVVPRNGAEVAP